MAEQIRFLWLDTRSNRVPGVSVTRHADDKGQAVRLVSSGDAGSGTSTAVIEMSRTEAAVLAKQLLTAALGSKEAQAAAEEQHESLHGYCLRAEKVVPW